MLVYGLPHTTTQALPTSITTPTPTPYSVPPPPVTNPTIFSRLSDPTFFTKGFSQALQTTIVTPTPTPYSDSLLSTCILTNLTEGFIQALPTSYVTPTPTHHGMPLFALPMLGFSRPSTSIFTIFINVLLRHYQPPTSSLTSMHSIR